MLYKISNIKKSLLSGLITSAIIAVSSCASDNNVMEDGQVTLSGKSVILQGNIISAGTILIDAGNVVIDGTIEARNLLRIKAENISISGLIIAPHFEVLLACNNRK